MPDLWWAASHAALAIGLAWVTLAVVDLYRRLAEAAELQYPPPSGEGGRTCAPGHVVPQRPVLGPVPLPGGSGSCLPGA